MNRARRVLDALTSPAVGVSPGATVEEAERVLADIEAHHLLVTTGAELHGLLCSCDLIAGAPASAVSDVMTLDPIVIDSRASLQLAVAAMDHYGVNCLPCLHEDVWGVVTRGDLVRLGLTKYATCVACGTHHHVRVLAAAETGWCRDCYDPRFSRDSIAPMYRDLGVPG